MNSTVLIVTLSLVMSVLLVNAEDDGRYHAEKYSQNAVFFRRAADGKYIPMNDRTYHHVHDRRELGRYVHVHIPYTGGYGPYDHMPNPYLHEGVPYIHDGDYEHPKTIEITSTTTTARPTRPRTRYDDEGKWRIIRQEENKQQKKYDYFFETENKIFAQEAGKVSGKEKEGTSGIGWYQYVGDDGKVYRVEYEAGEQGFVPKGDHIHKSIQKHLNSLKERNLI
ncbi:uncharacterized protein LOC116352146 isoform X3 [Contarinia nasturtii]|uniref:uncharacterized protein LOC116352146 isoform X3 n=1 Tax=Contarinia nasturtii TaxID=265458 RepID=UPI0012D3B6CF|nr:uncharacterized protein LOC116352146 isoform X3 [Contarinia nasturtii]